MYVRSNLLVFYQKGDKRVHVAPDVFVVRGVPKGIRPNYLLWEERPLDVVIELTSKTTMMEDIEVKYNLYVDKLGVKEYFLFDPEEEYLNPSFQGYRKVKDQFRPIKPVRLWNPADGERLPTPAERAADAEAEVERLRRELEQLHGKPGGK